MTPRRACLLVLLLAAVAAPVAAAPPDDYGPVGPFRLTERDGRTVSAADLDGKVWVASFVFTRCSGPCPSVTATMARLQGELKEQPDVRLVTFTVDPERDQLSDLNQYADRFGANPQRWLFLTGPKDDVYRLLREGFHVAVDQGKDSEGRPDINHSTRLVVVDRQGRIRGYYQGMVNAEMPDGARLFEEDLARLRQRVAALVREQP